MSIPTDHYGSPMWIGRDPVAHSYGTDDPDGNRARIGNWADFVYTRRGGVTHVLPFAMHAAYPTVLCGRELQWGEYWLGTGTQDEIDKARRMPLCIRCMRRSEGRNR